MEDPKLVAASAIALAVTLFAIFSIRPIARRLGLVDKPDGRKQHRGRIPLIGGLCFFLGMLVGLSYLGYLDRFATSLVAGGALIVLIGVVDDFNGLSVRSRLLAEAGVVALVILTSGYYVDDLGLQIGEHALRLGVLGVPVTIVAVIGLINAYNMLDGIDGLAASMAMVSIAAILFFDHASWSVPSVLLLLQILFAALIPYLFVNLGWPDGRKVFMGDAGSMLIGFLLAWSVVFLSHRSVARLAPVDVLWCVALPIMDTLAVMYRRLRSGSSPFKPDRQHLHHLLLDAGYPSRMALAAIILASGLLAMLGYVLRGAPSLVSVTVFAMVLLAYVLWLPQLLALLGTPFRLLRPTRAEEAVSVTAGGAGDGALMLEQEWNQPSDFDRRHEEAVAGGSAAEEQQQTLLKALCVLSAPADTGEIAPIAKQLLQDGRFEPTVCVTTAAGEDAGEALHRFDIPPDPAPGVAETGGESFEIGSAAFAGMERVLSEVQPDMVLVPDDTAASFAAALIAYCHRIPVVCVDAAALDAGVAAGWPDQASRKVVRNLASLHVARSESASRHLIGDGVPAERILVARRGESDACERIVEAMAGLRTAAETSSRPTQYVGPLPASAMANAQSVP